MNLPRESPASWRFHVVCCLSYTLLCVLWACLAPKDQSVDQLNYHVYLGLAWWQGRIPDELFAASAQGYLNPLPHLPFFAAIASGLPPRLSASLMAVLHSSNLWLVHGITCLLIAPRTRLSKALVMGSVGLGVLSPGFLLETGSSLVDVVVSIPSLAALWCLLYWLKNCASSGDPDYRPAWASALLAGAAAGLKPTAVVFSVTSSLAALLTAPKGTRWGLFWRLILGGIGGLLIACGSHALMLWRAFDNPIYPLFNSVFQSRWFPPFNLVSDRFRPNSWQDYLLFPLKIADPTAQFGFESFAIDYRPLWLVMLIPMALAPWARKLSGSGTVRRELVFFWASLLLFIGPWLYTSGNIRYALPELLLFGPAIGLASLSLARLPPIVPLFCMALPLAAQSMATFMLNAPRWDVGNWSSTWYDLDIPPELAHKPAYYLSLQTQTYSALALGLHPDSRMTNLVGQLPFDPHGLLWNKAQAHRNSLGMPWRSLFAVPMIIAPDGIPLGALDDQDALLSEYGLQADRSSCRWIILDGGGLPSPRWVSALPTEARSAELRRKVIISCLLHPAAPLPEAERSQRSAMDAAFSRWESRCPHLFAPLPSVSVQLMENIRSRYYANTEIKLAATPRGLVMIPPKQGKPTLLEDSSGHPQVKTCPDPRPQALKDQSR